MTVRIKDLAKPLEPLSPDVDLLAAHQRFRAEPEMLVLPIVRDGVPLGIVSRANLADILIEADHQANIIRQPVSHLMFTDPAIGNVTAPVAYIAANGQAGASPDLQQGVIAVEDGKYFGFVSAQDVLACLAKENMARAGLIKTLRQRAEVDQQKAERLLEDQARFLAFMSHEIRTPLTGVLGVADLLCDAGLEGELRDHARTISASGRLLDRLLSDVLDLSRLEAGKMPISPEPFKLGEFASETRALWATQFGTRGVTLNVSADDHKLGRIEADAMRLRQVLFNLVSNALKFTDSGRVDVRLTITPGRGGPLRLNMTVSDTGAGISDADKERLFKTFEQASASTVKRHGGSGLGLTIAKGLVERMGGRIALADNANGGSVFTVTCPVRRAGPRLAIDNPRKKTANFELGRLLVVDDHDVSRFVIAKALSAVGWTIDSVETADQARRRASAVTYQAILLDLRLGSESGLQLARHIRTSEGPNQGAILMATSADVREEVRAACTRMGFDAFVAKPIRPRDLVATLADTIVDARQRENVRLPQQLAASGA